MDRWARARPYVLPVLLLLAIALPHLGQGDWRGDAGWYSAISVQAWRTGHLWTLSSEPGQFYFNKPPLAFWIHGLILHLAGVSIWAARLPTVLASCGCVLATVAIARVRCSRWTALLAGCALALTYEFFRRNREISLDLWQLMFMLAAVWLIATGVGRDRPGLFAWAGVPLGLALLCKPLVALAALPIVAVWIVWAGPSRRVWWLIATALVSLVVAAPWHISMAMLHGHEFTGQYFGAEIAARAAGEAVGGQLQPKPVTFYLTLLVSTCWPWLAFVAIGAWAWLRGPALTPNRARLWKLGLVWFAAWFILLSIFADRRPRYAVALYPGFAWMAAIGLTSVAGLRPVFRGWLKWAAPIVIAGGLLFAALPVHVQGGADRQWIEFFAWMRDRAPDGVYDGAFGGAPAARVYLETGRWPAPTRDARERTIAEPPEGALLAYHRRGGRVPGSNEIAVFESGDLKVTRLGPGGWKPDLAADPGEK